jgi:putative toxin-antitoxin system antitoxin component (TIGR02293 family)
MTENLQPYRVVDDTRKKHTPGKHSLALARRRVAEASILDRAVEVIGVRSEAMRWMGTPVRALDYATPVSLLATAKGRATVLTVLGRLEYGVM